MRRTEVRTNQRYPRPANEKSPSDGGEAIVEKCALLPLPRRSVISASQHQVVNCRVGVLKAGVVAVQRYRLPLVAAGRLPRAVASHVKVQHPLSTVAV